MSETTYEVLARILRDNVAEAERCTADQLGYKDGLDAASARIQAAMYGLPRSDRPEWRGKPPGPLGGGGGGGDPGPEPTKPPDGGGGGKVIDADYSIIDPFSGKRMVAGQIENG
jgi:hypothetical protein